MDGTPHEAWPVERLARVSGVSEAHLARSFKAAFGVPPHRYLLTRRIERATALLRESDLAITEVAFQTGWTSLGSFGREALEFYVEKLGLRVHTDVRNGDFRPISPPATGTQAYHVGAGSDPGTASPNSGRSLMRRRADLLTVHRLIPDLGLARGLRVPAASSRGTG